MNVIAPGQWRDAESYRTVFTGGRSALAWELLRRDPLYCAATAGTGQPAAIGESDPSCVDRWGLHFRL